MTRRLLGLFVLLPFFGCDSAPPVPAAKTSIIGLDGADWRNVLPLIRQGKLPTLAALTRGGSSGTMLTNPDYRWSPVLWTSIATGKLPDKHGVEGFMAEVAENVRIPTPSTHRKVRALWNIFSERGHSVGFVGWWVTWPAEPVKGFMVTDHYSVSRFDLTRDFEAPEKLEGTSRQTYPDELLDEIDHFRVSRKAIGVDDLRRFANVDVDFEFPEQHVKFDNVTEFAIAHSVDLTHFGAGQHLLSTRDPELFGVFFQGADIMQHFHWEFLDPEGVGSSPSFERRHAFGESVERYYGFLDSRVFDLIEAGGDERSCLLVSDHGFRPGTERYDEKNISGEHRRQAFFLWAGPGVRRGHLQSGVDAIDIAPSVLAYHRLPVADDMDGDAVLSLFASIDPDSVEYIETFETSDWDRGGELPMGSEAADALRDRIGAIGYITE